MAKLSEFGAAFAAARKAGKTTFTFKGKSYTTKLKEEAGKGAAPRPKARPASIKAAPVSGASRSTAGKVKPDPKASSRPARPQSNPVVNAKPAPTKGEKLVAQANNAAMEKARNSRPLPARPQSKTPTRIERAATQAANARAETRKKSGIGGGNKPAPKPAKAAAPANGPLSIIKKVGDFLGSGGLAGMKARQRKAAADAAARQAAPRTGRQ